MREAIKVASVVVLLFAIPAAAIVWMDEPPSPTEWLVRVLCPLAALAAMICFLRLHFQRDIVPDYLRAVTAEYLNRDGFCFAIRPETSQGICYLNAYFQNQHDQPSDCRIALRPSRRFLLGRAPIPTLEYAIHCEPAAFGVARLSMPVPGELQGKRQLFDVGASVDYPQGKGRRLRFRDGNLLYTDCQFHNRRAARLAWAGLITGHLIVSFPRRISINLPTGVKDDLPKDGIAECCTLWKLGDPPYNQTA